MNCSICSEPIAPGQPVNQHHTVYKSRGGTEAAPTHKSCHIGLHSRLGDFREWGRLGGQISALDKHWAFTLKGVKDNPLYEQARAYHSAYYAQ